MLIAHFFFVISKHTLFASRSQGIQLDTEVKAVVIGLDPRLTYRLFHFLPPINSAFQLLLFAHSSSYPANLQLPPRI
jgi:hypothetical protein